jgi:hypothetical protein
MRGRSLAASTSTHNTSLRRRSSLRAAEGLRAVGPRVARSATATAAAVFPEGVPFDGKRLTNRCKAAFSYLRPIRQGDEHLVAQIFPRWNPLTSWIRQIEDFQRAA